MKTRSLALSDGSASLECSIRAPSPMPTSRSFRYEPAQSVKPLSSGESNVKTFLETPPVEVMTTTIRICGCSCRTSMWRIVVVPIGGR